MASFDTIASGIAQHAGTYVAALAVPAASSSVWRSSMTYADRLAELLDHGVSIWLDSLSRGRLRGGGLAALVRDRHVVGVTTNPTISSRRWQTARSTTARSRTSGCEASRLRRSPFDDRL